MSTLWSVPACGLATFICLRRAHLPWNVGLALAVLAAPFAPLPAAAAALGVVFALRRGGGDLAPRSWTRRSLSGKRPAVLTAGGLAIGSDERGQLVRIPLRRESGAHTLVVGATGSGKTVTQAWIVARAIDHGHGAVIIDPKGDALLRGQAWTAALAAGTRVHRVDTRWSRGLQPLRPRQRERDRRQGARRRALQRAALPAPGAALTSPTRCVRRALRARPPHRPDCSS